MGFFDHFVKNYKKEVPSLTMKEEMKAKEEDAVTFAQKRKVSAALYPNATVSAENHPGFKAEITDAHKLTAQASEVLTEHISDLVGTGGFSVEVDEFRDIKSHKDLKDHSLVNDEAIIAFSVDFEVAGGKHKTARMLVSHKYTDDVPLKVEASFYDTADRQYDLNSNILEAFLANKMENTIKMASTEKPLAWFNPKHENYEVVKSASGSAKVAARLKASGFEVRDNAWIDTCHGPKTFGRICTVVEVPMDRESEFLKIAAWSDDEWVNRAKEKSYKDSKDLGKDEAWVDRAKEKAGYDKKNLKEDSTWVDRALDKDSSKNPYTTEAKMMNTGAKKDEEVLEGVRKEAVAKSLASTGDTLANMVSEIDNLIK